jgi:hypothetical protein
MQDNSISGYGDAIAVKPVAAISYVVCLPLPKDLGRIDRQRGLRCWRNRWASGPVRNALGQARRGEDFAPRIAVARRFRRSDSSIRRKSRVNGIARTANIAQVSRISGSTRSTATKRRRRKHKHGAPNSTALHCYPNRTFSAVRIMRVAGDWLSV